MLTRGEFKEEYPPEELEEHLLDRPVASIRDIQYLYGTLYTLGTAGGGEYADYLTLGETKQNLDSGEGENVVAVQVDLSGETPRLDEDTPIYVTTFTDDLAEEIAHCYYSEKGSGLDHSITQQSKSGGYDPEKLGTEVWKRPLERWTRETAVEETVSNHPEGWIVTALNEFANTDGIHERIAEEVKARIGWTRTALLTVRVRVDADSSYQWPGEFEDESDIFNACMRAQRTHKLGSKGIDSGHSSGHATDFITETKGTGLGTISDPLNYYLTKQREKFPEFDPAEAWRSHPLIEDTSITIGNSSSFLDACTYRAYQATVYVLPYLNRTITPEDAYSLYQWLAEAAARAASDERSYDPIELAYGSTINALGDESPLRFFVAAVHDVQASLSNVYGDTMGASFLAPVSIREAHNAVLDSWVYDAGDRNESSASVLPSIPDFSLLNALTVSDITSGWYLQCTFPKNDTEPKQNGGSFDDVRAVPDDDRIDALLRLFSGQPLHIDTLLRAYTKRLTAERQENDTLETTVAIQFAQLCALARADLIDTTGSATANADLIAKSPTYRDHFMDDTDIEIHPIEAQHAKITRLIEKTPAFEDDERRGAFLLGALVGAVGSYQVWKEDRSTTLVDQYPVGSITPMRIQKVAHETIEKVIMYSRQEGQSNTRFEWLVDPLRVTLLETGTDGFSLSKDDLRFHYALGVTYGMNDRIPSSNDESTEDQTAEAMETN